MRGPAQACQSSKQTVEDGELEEGKEDKEEEEIDEEEEGEGWSSRASSKAFRSIPIKPRRKSKDAAAEVEQWSPLFRRWGGVG